MIIYVVLSLLILIVLSLGVFKINKIIINKIIFIILFLFTILRYNVGYDYMTYYNMSTDKIVYLETMKNTELLNKLILKLSWTLKEPQVLFIIYGVIIFTFLYLAIKENSSSKNVSLLFYYGFPTLFLGSLGMIRQHAAMTITLYSLKFIKKKNIYLFICFILFASLIHKSAILALPLYFFLRFKINKTIKLMLIILAFKLDKILIVLVDLIVPKYHIYLKGSLGKGGNVLLYLVIAMILAVILLSERLEAIKIENRMYVNSVLVGSIIYISLLKYGHAGLRGSMYYLMYYILLIPEVLKCFKEEKIIKKIYYCLMITMFISTIYTSSKELSKSAYIPYKIYFFKSI